MSNPAGDAAEIGAQLLAWGRHPWVWLLAALVLASLCTAITGARLAHHAGRWVLPWAVLGFVPVLGPLLVAYLAGAPGQEVLRRLTRIEDFLIRGIPPEQLHAMLHSERGGVVVAAQPAEAVARSDEPRLSVGPSSTTLEPEGNRSR